MLSLFVFSTGTSWAESDESILVTEAGILVWVPSVKYSSNSNTYSPSVLAGPEAYFMLYNFFAEATYLIPFTGFDNTITNTKNSWLNLLIGYMITPKIGLYLGYINNSKTSTVSSTTATTTNYSTISGLKIGMNIFLPISPIVNFYGNGSYTFGDKTYFPNIANSTDIINLRISNKLLDAEGGLGFKFLKDFKLTLCWKYQVYSYSDNSAMTFSGPYGSITYIFYY
jgi:hypothetical protein